MYRAEERATGCAGNRDRPEDGRDVVHGGTTTNESPNAENIADVARDDFSTDLIVARSMPTMGTTDAHGATSWINVYSHFSVGGTYTFTKTDYTSTNHNRPRRVARCSCVEYLRGRQLVPTGGGTWKLDGVEPLFHVDCGQGATRVAEAAGIEPTGRGVPVPLVLKTRGATRPRSPPGVTLQAGVIGAMLTFASRRNEDGVTMPHGAQRAQLPGEKPNQIIVPEAEQVPPCSVAWSRPTSSSRGSSASLP